MIDTSFVKSVDLVALVGSTTRLRKASTHQWVGPCPRCGGKDRFCVDPQHGWFCRQCTGEPGNGGEYAHWNDAIDFMRWMYEVDFVTACTRLGGRNLNASPAELNKIATQRAAAELAQAEQEARQQAAAIERLQKSRVWEQYHAHPKAVEAWRARGLSEAWVNFYKLGYCDAHEFSSGGETFTSPALAIPYWRLDHHHKWQCVGLRHRLLADPCPGGKYRPEFAGLGNHLFFSDPVQVRDHKILVVEGEIKAMVTWAALWDDSAGIDNSELADYDLTVIGMPGKSWKPEYLSELREARRGWVCLDPDAGQAADNMVKALGSHWKRISLPGKIDDLILSGIIDADFIVRELR